MVRFTEDFALQLPPVNEEALKRLSENLLPAGGSTQLEVTFEAIHEGLTRNNTFYTKNGLTHKEKNDQGQPGGLESWVTPYEVPILKDHEATADNALGRVKKAEWVDRKGGKPGHVKLTAVITQPEAIQKFLRGEYQTGSIGMDVDVATCSVCGADWKESYFGACEHARGKWYKKDEEGKWVDAIAHEPKARRMHINIGNTWAREYSLVSVPSDARSKVSSMQVLESVFTESDGTQVSLLEAPAITEGEDPVDPKTTTPPAVEVEEEKPTIEEKSVAELCDMNRTLLETDALSLYATLLSEFAHMSAGGAATGICMMKLSETESRSYTPAELEKFSTYIYENNPDLEEELNEIKASVLSSSTADLPDSAFALVKTNEGKAIRALPFRDASGAVEVNHMITALSRCFQISGYTQAEKAKGLKKLRAAARKRGFAASTPEEIAAEVASAKAFLAEQGVTTEPDTATQAKITSLETQLADAQRLIEERETENAELVEQVTEMRAGIETAKKQDLVEKILSLEKPAEDKVEERTTALQAESLDKLTTTLEVLEREAPEGVYIVQRMPKDSVAQGDGKEDAAADAAPAKDLPAEYIIGAFLGSAKAKKAVSTAYRGIK